MSELNSAPEINSTLVTKLPTQLLSHLQISQSMAMTHENIHMVNEEPFKVKDTDWIRLADKSKYFATTTWNVADPVGTTFFTQAINFNFISNFIPIGLTFNNFAKVKGIKINLKPTINTLAQGLAVLYYSPAPSANYFLNTFGISTTGPQALWQYKKLYLSPDNTDELEIFIPVLIPFEFFKLNPGTDTLQIAFANYLASYLFGTLRATVVTPLATKSPLQTKLTYAVRATIVGLEIAGLDV